MSRSSAGVESRDTPHASACIHVRGLLDTSSTRQFRDGNARFDFAPRSTKLGTRPRSPHRRHRHARTRCPSRSRHRDRCERPVPRGLARRHLEAASNRTPRSLSRRPLLFSWCVSARSSRRERVALDLERTRIHFRSNPPSTSTLAKPSTSRRASYAGSRWPNAAGTEATTMSTRSTTQTPRCAPISRMPRSKPAPTDSTSVTEAGIERRLRPARGTQHFRVLDPSRR